MNNTQYKRAIIYIVAEAIIFSQLTRLLKNKNHARINKRI